MSRYIPSLTLVPGAESLWFLRTTVTVLISAFREDILLTVHYCQDRLTVLWRGVLAADCCKELTVMSEWIAHLISRYSLLKLGAALRKIITCGPLHCACWTIYFFCGALLQPCLCAATRCLLLKNNWRKHRGRINDLLGLWFSFVWNMLVSPVLASHLCCISLCRFQNSPSLM